MANIKTKREEKREAVLDLQQKHRMKCSLAAKRSFEQKGDVFRCEHGAIYLATRKNSYYGWEFRTITRWRNPILFERAVRALAEEARNADA